MRSSPSAGRGRSRERPWRPRCSTWGMRSRRRCWFARRSASARARARDRSRTARGVVDGAACGAPTDRDEIADFGEPALHIAWTTRRPGSQAGRGSRCPHRSTTPTTGGPRDFFGAEADATDARGGDRDSSETVACICDATVGIAKARDRLRRVAFVATRVVRVCFLEIEKSGSVAGLWAVWATRSSAGLGSLPARCPSEWGAGSPRLAFAPSPSALHTRHRPQPVLAALDLERCAYPIGSAPRSWR
jgi:hypothetical protein